MTCDAWTPDALVTFWTPNAQPILDTWRPGQLLDTWRPDTWLPNNFGHLTPGNFWTPDAPLNFWTPDARTFLDTWRPYTWCPIQSMKTCCPDTTFQMKSLFVSQFSNFNAFIWKSFIQLYSYHHSRKLDFSYLQTMALAIYEIIWHYWLISNVNYWVWRIQNYFRLNVKYNLK